MGLCDMNNEDLADLVSKALTEAYSAGIEYSSASLRGAPDDTIEELIDRMCNIMLNLPLVDKKKWGEKCKWREVIDDDNILYFVTECNNGPISAASTIGFSYCPYCGKEIEL